MVSNWINLENQEMKNSPKEKVRARDPCRHPRVIPNSGGCPFSQARKRNPSPNFLVQISSGGVGFFHVKGWGPKSSVCPSKPRKTKLFGGISRDFCWDIPGTPENVEKKRLCSKFCSLFRPSKLGTRSRRVWCRL